MAGKSIEKLANSFMASHPELITKYSYLRLTAEETNRLLFKVIEVLRKTHSEPTEEQIISEFKDALERKQIQVFNDKNKIIDSLERYVELNFSDNPNYKQANKDIRGFQDLCKKSIRRVTPDVICTLLNKQPKFKEALAQIEKKYHNDIVTGNIESKIDSELLRMLLGLYCSSVGIDIKIDEVDEESEDLNTKYTIALLRDSERYFDMEIRRIPQPTAEENQRLLIIALTGKDPSKTDDSSISEDPSKIKETAINSLIEGNLRLVKNIAIKFLGRGFELQDLEQEGTLGIIEAINHYSLEYAGVNKEESSTNTFKSETKPSIDEETSEKPIVKFSTFAYFWIKQSIQRALENKARTQQIPSWLEEKLAWFDKRKAALATKYGRNLTVSELCNELHWPISIVELLLYRSFELFSLEKPVLDGDEETGILGDFIQDKEDCFKEAEDQILLNEVLCSTGLTKVEKNVFSLAEIQDETLQIIANNWRNIHPGSSKETATRQRVEEVLNSAKRKIRMSHIADFLIEFAPSPEKARDNLAIMRKFYLENPTTYRSFKNDFLSGKFDNLKNYSTIYNYFLNYTPEQVDEVIGAFSIDKKSLIYILFQSNIISMDENKRLELIYVFETDILPLMKRLIRARNRVTQPSEGHAAFKRYKERHAKIPIMANPVIAKHISDSLSQEESEIAALKYGVKDNICLSNGVLAILFNKTEKEIAIIIRKWLDLYKSFLDNLKYSSSQKLKLLKK